MEDGRANVEEGRLQKEAGRVVKEKSRKGRAASKKEKEELGKDNGAPKAAQIFNKPLLPTEGAEKIKAKIDQYKKALEAAKGSIKEAKSGGNDLKKASLLKDAGEKIKAKAKHVRDIGRDMIDAGNALKGEGRKLLSNGDKCVLIFLFISSAPTSIRFLALTRLPSHPFLIFTFTSLSTIRLGGERKVAQGKTIKKAGRKVKEIAREMKDLAEDAKKEARALKKADDEGRPVSDVPTPKPYNLKLKGS